MDSIQRSRSGSNQSRQPVYRRPSWAQNEKSYEIYMRKSLAADRSPGADSGHENYSYDESHVKEWQVPKGLEVRLPAELKDAITEWMLAGAAVCTSLARIAKLDDESLYRAYPEKTIAHLSRRESSPSSAVFGATTPPTGFPASQSPFGLSAGLLRLDKFEQLPQRQAVGMESPPFTPVETRACPSPEISCEQRFPTSGMPDPSALAQQLSPLSMATDPVAGAGSRKSDMATGSFDSTLSPAISTTSSTPSLAAFDETAWETFLKTYNAELFDIRTHAGPRFKGAGYTVDKARVEMGMGKEHQDALADFNEWWTSMKPKVTKYDAKLRELEMPNIDTVRAERSAHGLPL